MTCPIMLKKNSRSERSHWTVAIMEREEMQYHFTLWIMAHVFSLLEDFIVLHSEWKEILQLANHSVKHTGRLKWGGWMDEYTD